MTGADDRDELPPGDDIGLRVHSLHFRSGHEVSLEPTGVIIVVGPNNAGKSSLLRELQHWIARHRAGPVLAAADHEVVLSARRLRAYLRAGPSVDMAEGSRCFTHQTGTKLVGAYGEAFALRHFSDGTSGLGDLTDFVAPLFRGIDAASALAQPVAIGETLDLRNSILSRLSRDEEYAAEVDTLVRRVFGVGIYLARRQEYPVVLRVGDAPDIRLPRAEYDRLVSAAPTLHDQGDGLRTFVGTLFLLGIWPAPLVLVDEPETFLHPPQAVEMGRAIGNASAGRQIVVATHSSDILRGVIDSGARCQVIHLRRTNDGPTRPHVMSSEQVQELTRSPFIRHSRVMDGLFHDVTVLCEGEPDATYYGAVYDACRPKGDVRRPDVLFLPLGGKAAYPRAVELLSGLGVPWRAIADFDALTDDTTAATVARAARAPDEPEIAVLAGRVNRAIKGLHGAPLLTAKVKAAVEKAFLAAKLEFDVATRKAIEEAVKSPSPFAATKRQGFAALQGTEPRADARRLMELNEKVGLFVVPVGELESWDRDAGGKQGWVAESIDRHEKAGTWPPPDVVEFVGRVVVGATPLEVAPPPPPSRAKPWGREVAPPAGVPVPAAGGLTAIGSWLAANATPIVTAAVVTVLVLLVRGCLAR